MYQKRVQTDLVMLSYKVKVSDGDSEWVETISANNEDHLWDIIDAMGLDVIALL